MRRSTHRRGYTPKAKATIRRVSPSLAPLPHATPQPIMTKRTIATNSAAAAFKSICRGLHAEAKESHTSNSRPCSLLHRRERGCDRAGALTGARKNYQLLILWRLVDEAHGIANLAPDCGARDD